MSNPNTPYPATAYLAGHLRAQGVEAAQADWSLEVAHKLLSRDGLARLRERALQVSKPRSPLRGFLELFEDYLHVVDSVVRFLQGREPALAGEIASGGLLPPGRRVQAFLDGPERGRTEPERAQYLASLCVWELVDAVRELCPGFKLVSYGEDAGRQRDLDAVLSFVSDQRGNLVDALIEEVVREGFSRHEPDVLGLTVPFKGNLPGALRVAEIARELRPDVRILMGGGYANTCLRRLGDPRLFDLVDFVTLDDGEGPLTCLLEHLRGEREAERLVRTFLRVEGAVVYRSGPDEADVPFRETVAPSFAGLPLERYFAVQGQPTAADRVWARRWNKLTLAHGCYWGKCTFCDTSLDYVERYEPQRAQRLVDQVEQVVAETGHTGFHFVDEAAPPSLLRAFSRHLLERQVEITWWGNVRFEKAFTPDLVELLAKAGCIMITAGLEVASDRLLRLMRKGVSVGQVARVARAFAERGVLVHAYLMYGFPTQTVQETVDSLELVRQLFLAGCLHSAHWHRFVVTEHSPIGRSPETFGIRLRPPEPGPREREFARLIVEFDDPTGVDHEALGEGLVKALRQYQLGLDLERDVGEWFSLQVPVTTVPADWVASALAAPQPRRIPLAPK